MQRIANNNTDAWEMQQMVEPVQKLRVPRVTTSSRSELEGKRGMSSGGDVGMGIEWHTIRE